jgi:serine/threonine protein kinase
MGAVFVARDAQGRRVALKVVLSDDARFEVEGRTAGRLAHPNVVSVQAAGRDGARSWLAMELVEGEALDARVRRGGPLDPRDAARWIAQAARGVEHAHTQQVLHRDLKPANIIVDAAGVARVLDFGVARDARSAERLTQTGELVGTPAYMAPEQASGEKELDRRVDVWGLGATLYDLLVGRAPFQGTTALNIVTSILTAAPRPPRVMRPDLDPALEAIVLRCLTKAPNGRYASAGELAAELEAWSERAARPARSPVGWLLVGAGLLLLALPLASGLLPTTPAPAPAPPPAATSTPPPATPTEPTKPPTEPAPARAPAPTAPEPKVPDPPSIEFAPGPVEPAAPDAKALLREPARVPDLVIDLTATGRARAPDQLELREGWWATPRTDGVLLRTSTRGAPRLRLPLAAPTGPLEVWVDADVAILDPYTTFGVTVTGPDAADGVGLRLAGELLNQSFVAVREQPALVRFEPGRGRPAQRASPGAASQPDGVTRLEELRALRLRLDPSSSGEVQARGFVSYELLRDAVTFAPGDGGWAIEVGVGLPGLDVRSSPDEPPSVASVLVRRIRVWGAQQAPGGDEPTAALGRAAWAQLARGDAAPLRALPADAATRDQAALLVALGAAERDAPAGETPRDRAIAEREAADALDRLSRRRVAPDVLPPDPTLLAGSVAPARRALLARALARRGAYDAAVADGQQFGSFGRVGEPPTPDWCKKALNLLQGAADRGASVVPTVEQRFGEGCVWFMAGDFDLAQELLEGSPTAIPSPPATPDAPPTAPGATRRPGACGPSPRRTTRRRRRATSAATWEASPDEPRDPRPPLVARGERPARDDPPRAGPRDRRRADPGHRRRRRRPRPDHAPAERDAHGVLPRVSPPPAHAALRARRHRRRGRAGARRRARSHGGALLLHLPPAPPVRRGRLARPGRLAVGDPVPVALLRLAAAPLVRPVGARRLAERGDHRGLPRGGGLARRAARPDDPRGPVAPRRRRGRAHAPGPLRPSRGLGVRRYEYVGPPEVLKGAAEGKEPGDLVLRANDVRAWALRTDQRPDGEGLIRATYTIGAEGDAARGRLRVRARGLRERRPRARGRRGLVRGRPPVGDGRADRQLLDGLLPRADLLAAVERVLDAAGIGRPSRFSKALLFRRCRCGQRNVVKDDHFVCALCDADLPAEWNFERTDPAG